MWPSSTTTRFYPRDGMSGSRRFSTRSHETGMVLPAVTAAGNPVTVRTEPGETVERLASLWRVPQRGRGRVEEISDRGVGGLERGIRASQRRGSRPGLHDVGPRPRRGSRHAESSIEHVSQASMQGGARSDGALSEAISSDFSIVGTSGPDGPMLDTVSREDYVRNLERARTAVAWIRRMLAARDEVGDPEAKRSRAPSTRSWLRPRS